MGLIILGIIFVGIIIAIFSVNNDENWDEIDKDDYY